MFGHTGAVNRAPLPSSTAKSAAWSDAPLRIAFVVAAAAVILITVALASNTESLEFSSSAPDPTSANAPKNLNPVDGELPPIGQTGAAPPELRPIRIPRPVLIVAGILAAVAVLYFLSLQRIALQFRRSKASVTVTKPTLTVDEEADEIVRITRDLIDELAEGDDPRLAIQRAYAAVETGFGTEELARRRAETPLQYLGRVFGRNENAAPPLRELTKLFELARFSQAPVDESMRTDAIAHLTEIRERYKDQLAAKSIKFSTRAL